MINVTESDRISEEEAIKLIEEYKTVTDKERKDFIGERLLKNYYMYMISFLSHQYTSLYSNDSFQEDLIATCSLAFFEHISEYDASKGKVTTFFIRHFKHAVSDYFNLLNNQTAYYGQKTNEIKRCIKDLESKGQSWDEAVLSNATGLPLKTIRVCLEQMNNAACHIASSDFLEENLTQMQESPEAEAIAKEEADGIRRAMKCLAETEKKIITLAFGFGDDNKTMSDTKIAKELNMKLDAVKRAKNSGMTKMARSFEKEGLFMNRMFKKEITMVNNDICLIPRGTEALLEFANDMADVVDIDF